MTGNEILDRMERILAGHGKRVGLGSQGLPAADDIRVERDHYRVERDRLAEALRLTHTPRPCATKLMRDKCPACDALEALDA